MKKQTVKIKIWGIVQGVGFRPFVAKLADRMNMMGEVLNIGGLVHIIVTDTDDRISNFIDALKRDRPTPSEIVHIKSEKIPLVEFKEFTILQSDEGGNEATMIPADLAICPNCLEELFDETNPRFMHPFISCMECGPRYTIVDKVPYDRENTSMVDFSMCDFCEKEYTDRADRRYHAQTISCHDCGPVLKCKFKDSSNQPSIADLDVNISEEFKEVNPKRYKIILDQVIKPLRKAVELLRRGEIIALKGMGGYNLLCDPRNEEAIRKLRKLKGREEKPFAVMFKSMEQIRECCIVTPEEESLLTSSARPIVLLERNSEMISEETYKNSRFIGAFMPSIGAQYLLLEHISPLIVTSANLTDQIIIIDDEKMFAFLEKEPLLTGVFYNERKIRIPLDDSVVRVIDGQPQIIRRAKGYAPVPLYVEIDQEEPLEILATGGQLKSTFSISKGPFVYTSQHFCDLDTKEAESVYCDNLERMKILFRIEPHRLAYDMHPLYTTTRLTEDYLLLPQKYIVGFENDEIVTQEVKTLRVQHHHGHIASVMAEHNLKGPIIGVAFDGTGYGEDGNIWGGEFLICEGAYYKRAAHLAYIKMLGGDSSMKEGWKSAMSYLYQFEKAKNEKPLILKKEKPKLKEREADLDEIHLDISEIIESSKIKENPNWELVKSALENKVNVIESSSMGRLFDAVASLLDIQHTNRYEGECAIMLENAASEAQKNPGVSEKNDMALKFHKMVAEMILTECLKIKKTHEKQNENKSYDRVALSGGVFQNKILMEKSLALLRENDFQVFYNISVPPNDGGIALGQNYIAMQFNNR